MKIDTGFQTSKIDSEFQVDKTSDEYKSIMKLYDDICKDYMNTLSEHNKSLHNKLLTDPSKDLYEKVRSSAMKAKAGYIKKVQLKLWMRMMRFPRRSCRVSD